MNRILICADRREVEQHLFAKLRGCRGKYRENEMLVFNNEFQLAVETNNPYYLKLLLAYENTLDDDRHSQMVVYALSKRHTDKFGQQLFERLGEISGGQTRLLVLTYDKHYGKLHLLINRLLDDDSRVDVCMVDGYSRAKLREHDVVELLR